MLLGIISDTHNRYQTVGKALDHVRRRKINCLLHCGDIENVETVRLFEGIPTHFVFGNCDLDRDDLREAIRDSGQTLYEPFGNIELEGIKLAWLHGDDKGLFNDVANSGHFDFLFYGHTHHAEKHQVGSTWVINPGALHRVQAKTFLILDLASKAWETVIVE